MKKTTLLLACLLLSIVLYAQSLQTVIATAGDYSGGSGASLAYTVGESVISYAEGFHPSAVLRTQTLVDETIPDKFSVFPNPVSDKINIEVTSQTETIAFYDITGRMLQQIKPTGKTTAIDIAAYKPGVYFVVLRSTNNSTTCKIVKQ